MPIMWKYFVIHQEMQCLFKLFLPTMLEKLVLSIMTRQYKFCPNSECINVKYLHTYTHRPLIASELEEFQGLLFRCHNYDLGCIQTIRLDELNTHQIDCQKNQDPPLQLKWLDKKSENKKNCYFCCELKYVRWQCVKTSQEVCYQCKPMKLSLRKCCYEHQLLFQMKSANNLICDNCQFTIITPFWSDYICNLNLCNYCFIQCI